MVAQSQVGRLLEYPKKEDKRCWAKHATAWGAKPDGLVMACGLDGCSMVDRWVTLVKENNSPVNSLAVHSQIVHENEIHVHEYTQDK